jgi:hypothetical protein
MVLSASTSVLNLTMQQILAHWAEAWRVLDPVTDFLAELGREESLGLSLLLLSAVT